MSLLLFTGDRVWRARLLAHQAPGTLVGVDSKRGDIPTDTGRTPLVVYMRLVLLSKILQGGQDRVGSRFPEPAQRRHLNLLTQSLDLLQVLRLALPSRQPVEQGVELIYSLAAGDTLPAGLLHQELEEVLRHVDHAGAIVHHDHSAGAHHGARLRKRIEIDGKIEIVLSEASTRRAACLHGLEWSPVYYSAAYPEDDIAQLGAHGNLDETGIDNLSHEAEGLGPG